MTSRQFYIMLLIFVIMTKMQRFSTLLFSEIGKDGYLIILLYLAVNILFIMLAFFIYKFLNRDKLRNKSSSLFVLVVKDRKIPYITS